MQKRINVSASQIENYRQCPRRWWFRSIKKLAEPQSEAQRVGDRFAKAIEARLKGQPIPRFDAVADLVIDRFLTAADAYFPVEPNPLIIAEKKIEFDVPDLPARMIGYIDVLDLSGEAAHIRDHKTRADRKYALSHQKLVSDVQLNIYAYAIRLELPAARFIDSTIGHINYVKPPKKMANNIEYLTDEWQPEVFVRQIPLDITNNDAIMDDVKMVIADMVNYSDSLLTPEQVPFDTTGDACYSYGQPCTYSAICPKFNLTPRNTPMALKSLPPPPPARSAAPPAPPAAPAAAAPPAPPAPPAPAANLPPRPPAPAANLPPAPPANLPPRPPAPGTSSLKMRPPQQAEVPWENGQPFSDPFDVKSVETDKGINPPSLKSVFEFPPADTEDESPPIEREATPPLPLANILNLSQKAKAWLAETGFETSVEVAHLTESYLMGQKLSKAVLNDLLKAALILRGLHKIAEPDPFENCPPLGPEGKEPVASKAEMLADLPDHPADPAPIATKAAPPAPPAKPPAAPPAPRPPASTASAPAAELSVNQSVAAPGAVPNDAPFYLYLECFPIKGATFVTLEEWLDPIFSEIEEAAGVTNWRSIVEFGRVNEMLHIAVRQCIEGKADYALPQHLVVLSSYTEYAKATLDLLIRRATLVVKK